MVFSSMTPIDKVSKHRPAPSITTTLEQYDCSCGGALSALPDGSWVQGILYHTDAGYKFVLKNNSTATEIQESIEQLRKVQSFFAHIKAPLKRIREISGTKEGVMAQIQTLNRAYKNK